LAESGNDPQQRALAAAGGAEQTQKFAAMYIEIDPVERRYPRGEALADTA
jgi:hypothetical protein